MAQGLANGTSSTPEQSYNALNYGVMLKLLKGILQSVDAGAPAPFISPPNVLPAVGRPGLSARKVASAIISRQSEAGAPSGPLPNGQGSIAEKMEVIRVEEIIKAIQQDMRITTVNTIPIAGGAPPGTVGGTGLAQ